MKAKRAVIVGYDAISPLGSDLDGQWRQAVAGKSGIGPLTRFPLKDDFPVRIAGQMPDIDHEPYPFLTARHQAAWHSPVFRYGMLSAARALGGAASRSPRPSLPGWRSPTVRPSAASTPY